MKSTILLLMIIFSIVIFGQTNEPTIFKITAQSEVSVLADVIVFQITISEENNDPEQAYRIHKEKESKLAKLIKDLGIEDTAISYSLLSISKSRMQKNKGAYKTSQKIKLELKDFSLYEKIQIELLKNGINEFKSVFSSDKAEKTREEGIRKLIEAAEKEAKTYADNLGLKVGRVISIDTKTRRYRSSDAVYFTAKPDVDISLLEIPQSYNVKLFANISFALVN
ncbi:hypothetical protein MNBD_IGNAVI01-1002 [hydrothermal vent metagenome]|uniref:DUF541 domain-containing protein n=1 Tax=hydrothermal vent metagenome TaxID=652676 RepID=A0A3B1CRI5_9ZZZZ